MRTLMVTQYAPYRDGIASYAVQEVRQRLLSGEEIKVLSPLPSAAHFHLKLGEPSGFRNLLSFAKDFDHIIIQLSPDILFSRCKNILDRLRVWKNLKILCSKTSVEVRVHEINYAALNHRLEKNAARNFFNRASLVTMHTQKEVDDLTNQLEVKGDNVELFDHGKYFRASIDLNVNEARKYLGLPDNKFIFLCIGFVQRHKAFDQAVKAFTKLNNKNAELYIVGSARIDAPEILEYVDELEMLISESNNVFFIKEYISDYDFDVWIQAVDTVILPYEEIWSSGVLERAKLFDTQIIARQVGGIVDQVNSNSQLFTSQDELIIAMEKSLELKGEKLDTNSDLNIDEVEMAIRKSAKSRANKFDDVSLSPSEVMNRLPSLVRPDAQSPNIGKAKLKKFVLKLINWQLNPVAKQVDELQDATTIAINNLEERIKKLEDPS